MPSILSSRSLTGSPDPQNVGFLPSPGFPPEPRGVPFFAPLKKKKSPKATTMPSSEKRSVSGAFRGFRRHSDKSTPVTTPPVSAASASPPIPDLNNTSDLISFPKVYEEAWGGPEVNRTELERARIFLLRMGVMVIDGQAKMAEMRAIVGDETNRTVPGIAWAIQMRIYGNRHADFAATPLLQAVRFMLIKARVPQSGFTDRSRAVLDFFFDPTLHRDVQPPPPGEMVRYPYPSGRLRVCIIGGGPTGLASAISLAEKGQGRVEVHVWERRWVVTDTGTVDYPPTARRRDQVVTLQDSVTTLLTPRTFEALFEGHPERVWPGSANIQIRKVEDRLLSRCQTDEFHGLIHLHAEGVTREELAAGKCGDFHVLLGTDGAASWVRGNYFRGYEKERGRSYALGLAFDRGSKGGLPWTQSLNMFLTLGQTRYLLNASDFDGRGYLNMQLTEEEWDKMVGVDGKPIHFGSPACFRRPDGTIPEGFEPGRVFAPSEDRNSPLWKSIEDGLKLFGFKEEEVINLVRIPIVVQAVREGVQPLPLEDSRFVARPHALVAVAGDAAMTVHFWPGRGLNSGIKAGLALGDEICHALKSGKFAGLQISAMKEYNDFIMKLQGREHDKRSIPILNQSGSPEMLGWLLKKAQAVPDEVAIEWLVGAMTQIADRLELRDDWYFPHESNIEAQIRIILRQLNSLTLREMAVSFPWPTREMAGAEVLPIRSMRPEEKRKWLQQLWSLVKDEKSKDSARGRERSTSTSNARFEAPRPRSKSPLPPRGQSPRPETPPPPAFVGGPVPQMPSVAPVAQLESLNLNPLASHRRSLSPTPGSLRRSNATNAVRRASQSGMPPGVGMGVGVGAGTAAAIPPHVVGPERPRRFSNSRTLAVPTAGMDGSLNYSYLSDGEDYVSSGDERYPRSTPSTTPGSSSPASRGDGGLTRLLSVRKPNDSFLADAMSLALFRVNED
ncbi:hypothetical protein CHGG_06853 [Chaetomium globosum CBS 148.51]|uniref:Uncharacterized protein n=1 Tax=Chaetomium globosum (strain ATCC 6205 / CBS 148.51 / DSM 1962 / NBRC 6347 / NRRL 1970) TaxID=306901 RepID=Q2GYV1_CHAGB|nr:uncharacterized protein CHGG_06853 [Chaetomium globosum CBS 148.51]EAQ85600.1 hypothetical protein CHGG_06853 [Chaetomium globosum CBS 148.51]